MVEDRVTRLEQEILEQPAALERLLEAELQGIKQLAGVIRDRSPRLAMFAARGSSDNAARYGQYLFGAVNRLAVALASPSLFTIYGKPPHLEETLVMGISQSGESPDVVSVIEEGRHQGGLTVAITGNPRSPLGKAAEYIIALSIGGERSVAATKSYTASLVVLAALSACLVEDDDRLRALRALPDFLSRLLSSTTTAKKVAERYRDMMACVVIGRGFNYSTAFEIALKLTELAHVQAQPYSAADFLHGPIALVQPGFPIVAVVPEGPMGSVLLEALLQLRQKEAKLIVISPLPKALALADTAIPLPTGVEEWMSPIVAAVPGQLFSLGLSLAKGLDPDHPRGLRKVTKTR